MNVPEVTPPELPASSPTLRVNSDPLIAHMLPPSAATVAVPPDRSVDRAIFGYGTGTGPPGDGVRQTSGRVAVVMPPLERCTSEMPLMLTVMAMERTRGRRTCQPKGPPLRQRFGLTRLQAMGPAWACPFPAPSGRGRAGPARARTPRHP